MPQIIVSYDVVSDNRRARLAKFLVGFLDRVQKSVFEGQIDDRQLARLRAGLVRRVDPDVDSVRIYLVCQRCVASTEVVGVGAYIEADDSDILV